MLANAKAVGFIQVSDTQSAREFYEGVLGLSLTDDGFALVADLSGAMLRITTLPGWTATDHPSFGFIVPDAHAAAADLSAKGVAFERYAFLGDAQAADGVWTSPNGSKVAWFKDPDGNLLSFTSNG